MPLYQYACSKCGHSQSHLQKINDDPIENCPECASPEYEKVITAASFELKGKGWYKPGISVSK